MKTSHLLRGLLSLFFTVGLLSCNDHRIPAVTPGSPTDRLRVKSITQETPDQSARADLAKKVSLFSYDMQGRLSSMLTFQTPDSTVAPVELSHYTYDAQNRLTQLRHEIVRRSGADPKPYELYVYDYNMAAQVAKLDYSNNNLGEGDPIWKVTFQYSPDNWLRSSVKSYNLTPISYTENSEYTFTGKNLTKVVTATRLFRSPATTITGSETINFTHDSGLNPFYGVFVIPAPYTAFSNPHLGILDYYTYYGGFDNVLNLSKNNVISAGSTTYAYTYNSANLPLTRTTTTDGKVTEILQYDYESY